MLHELHVSGLGVIDDLDLTFHPGLNVLTGETGAGKTMITVALALALGRRASTALVREGAGAARVQARFDATPPAEAEGWAEEGSLVLARTVDAAGRSSARAGGQLAPVSVLERLGDDLVEVHGQHEGALLRSAAAQTEFLDRFAGPDHLTRLEDHRGLHARLSTAAGELEDLARTERVREREADLLAYQLAEIERAAPRPGELAALEADASRLSNAERIRERAGEAERALSADGGGAELLALAARALGDAGTVDPSARGLGERATALAEEAAELSRDLRGYRDALDAALDADPARLEEVTDRIAAIRGLLRKYGETEEAVLAFLGGVRERLAALATTGGRRAELEAEALVLRERTAGLAGEIRRRRAAAAPDLSAAIEAELWELGMGGATVDIRLVDADHGSAGTERAEILFSGGPRQRALPLSKVASGGELSRTMLACRSVLVDVDAVPTLVFDEVDAGIGGAAAAAVGRRLARLARERQVLVVTHLPQIASFADRHVVVEKAEGTATARAVDGPERVAELSRMLSGLPGSDAAAVHAEELLAEAGRLKGA